MISIIPAKGKSEGLPGKNIKLLNGKPLIVYSIEAALNSKNIDKVIVSTDSEDIARIAVEYGAEVPFLRPSYLATKNAHAIDNYIYTIEKLNSMFGMDIKKFVVLQPTSPLRTTFDIDKAIELFENNDADSVISYTEESHPIYWHKRIKSDLTFENIFDDTIENRQSYDKTFYPNGSVFVFKFSLIKQRKYYSEKSYAYIMPRYRSIDIDTLDDFKYAEFLLKELEKNENK